MPEAVERYSGIADDQEPRTVDGEHGLDGVLRPLVRPDEPEAERRPAVVTAVDRRPEDRVADHAHVLLGEPEVDQLSATALGVDDDALEAREQRPPHRGLRERAARDDVVRREDGGAARTEEPAIELRRAEPLDVHDVGLREREAAMPNGCSTAFTARRSRVDPMREESG